MKKGDKGGRAQIRLAEPLKSFSKSTNVRGQKIRILVCKEEKAGSYSGQWNGLNDVGHSVSSGVYLSSCAPGSLIRHVNLYLYDNMLIIVVVTETDRLFQY